MRVVQTGLLVAAMVVAASAGGAAEPGQIGIHVGVAREPDGWMAPRAEPDFSFSYQATERLSLRPWLGLGHSKAAGWHWDLGATAIHSFRPGRRFTPYLGAGLRYRTRDAFGTARPIPLPGLEVPLLPDQSSRHDVTFSALGGMEYTISRRLSLFGEVEARYRTGRGYRFEEGEMRLRGRGFSVRPVVGLTVKLR